MIKLFRWMFWLASTLLGLVVFTAVLAYYFAARSLPEYDGEFTVSGISAPVEIVRRTSSARVMPTASTPSGSSTRRTGSGR